MNLNYFLYIIKISFFPVMNWTYTHMLLKLNLYERNTKFHIHRVCVYVYEWMREKETYEGEWIFGSRCVCNAPIVGSLVFAPTSLSDALLPYALNPCIQSACSRICTCMCEWTRHDHAPYVRHNQNFSNPFYSFLSRLFSRTLSFSFENQKRPQTVKPQTGNASQKISTQNNEEKSLRFSDASSIQSMWEEK